MKTNIVYYSATGNTEMMAQHIYEVLSDKGFDVNQYPVEDVELDVAKDCDLIILGSPAMAGEQIEEYEFRPFFDSILPDIVDKKVIIFGSYDWGEKEWLENWREELSQVGITPLFEFAAMLDPQDEDLEEITNSLNSL